MDDRTQGGHYSPIAYDFERHGYAVSPFVIVGTQACQNPCSAHHLISKKNLLTEPSQRSKGTHHLLCLFCLLSCANYWCRPAARARIGLASPLPPSPVS